MNKLFGVHRSMVYAKKILRFKGLWFTTKCSLGYVSVDNWLVVNPPFPLPTNMTDDQNTKTSIAPLHPNIKACEASGSSIVDVCLVAYANVNLTFGNVRWGSVFLPGIPTDKRSWSNAVSMLVHRLRRWSNIKPTLFNVYYLGWTILPTAFRLWVSVVYSDDIHLLTEKVKSTPIVHVAFRMFAQVGTGS